MRPIVVWGTSSWAGKSLLATGLCASLRRRGIRVAPFKAQNMSNNARAVDGGEIGAAQYFQALAAGVAPSVDHNPVLLKPENDRHSQVVVLGKVDGDAARLGWRERSDRLWEAVAGAYERVARAADVVVIEGAGSPAEVNLADVDLANLRIARHAGATAVLVTDIDRGGAFAHLVGTWTLLEPADRARVAGFVLNRFRGDPALLHPAPLLLRERTGVPTLGVLPMVDHGLPDEDGADPSPRSVGGIEVRVVRGPAASNLDEWWLVQQASSFAWATQPSHLRDADLVVLPGSKLVATDLAWMRATGMDAAVAAAHARGVPILAVCGGVQALCERVDDPHGVERAATGLGLLPAVTVLGREKHVRRTSATFSTSLGGPWRELAGRRVAGYEIRYGTTAVRPPAAEVLPGGTGFAHGTILAVYLHGLAEDPDVVHALTGRRPLRSIDQVVDGLADLVDEHLDLGPLLRDRPAGARPA